MQFFQNTDNMVRLQIKGMSCSSCSSSIENLLRKKDGVIEANVYILNHSGVVRFDSSKCSVESIIKDIESLGFKAAVESSANMLLKPNINRVDSINKHQFYNSVNRGMDCFGSMSRNDDSNDKETDSINPHSNSDVAWGIGLETDSIKTANNTQTSSKTESNNKKGIFSYIKLVNDYIENVILNNKRRLAISILLSIIVVYISMLRDMFNVPMPYILDDLFYNAILQLFLTLCVAHCGRAFYIRGIRAIIALRPNMDSLVSLGTLAGFLYSLFNLINGMYSHLYFEGVCVILTFIMLGKYIEENAKNKALNNAKSLLVRQPKLARKITTTNLDSKIAFTAIKPTNNMTFTNNIESISEIDVDLLQVGDYISILPHSYVPVDCILCSPEASIDESMLSGESVAVVKKIDSKLFAGTLNLDIAIKAKVTHTASQSTIAKMQELINSSLESKAKIAELADKISSVFVPIVMLLALCSGVFWLFKEGIESAMLYFASTLLISCPCALGLATPMALLFANSRANKMGIFFKNAKSLENLNKIDFVVFDKTGTLTDSNFKLHSIELANIESKIDCHSNKYPNNDLKIDSINQSPNGRAAGFKEQIDSINSHNSPLQDEATYSLSLQESMATKACNTKGANPNLQIYNKTQSSITTSSLRGSGDSHNEAIHNYIDKVDSIKKPTDCNPAACNDKRGNDDVGGNDIRADLKIDSKNITTKQNITKETLLKIAASMEKLSSHIIAKAICAAAKGMPLYQNTHTKSYARGIESSLIIDSIKREFIAGSTSFLKEYGIDIKSSSNSWLLGIHIAEKIDSKWILLGSIYLEENLKEDSKAAIKALQDMGLKSIILSGDKEESVAYIANKLGMEYKASCTPEDKMKYIESLQHSGHKVMMIGDGINDSIAIARSDISLVMAKGSEVSIEYGDIIYFHDRLGNIVSAIQLGSATISNIKQNLAFAFIYNIICIPIAMGCFSAFGISLSPMLASLAMSLSSISVVSNSSRLYRFKTTR